jgi:membrane protease YdiL (CAAX protease family)
LKGWTIWLPWILLALINPWIEEFYWRGLLLDYTKNWPKWASVLFVSILFATNHIAFGINSNVTCGFEIIISTFIMGVAWAIIYMKSKSLRWSIFSHFLIDFFGVSSVAFLDLFDKVSF